MLWRELVRRPASTRSSDGADVSAGAATGSGDEESYRRGDAQARQAMLDELSVELTTRPGLPIEWTRLGDWNLDQGHPAPAESAFRKALHLQPMHARAHEGLGLALLKQGKLEEAYLRLDAATKLAPNSAEHWIHWGLVDLEYGQLDGAAEKFQRGIDRAPGNSHGWHNLALVAMKRGETSRAIELFERALALKSDHGLAHSNLALALVMADRLPEAAAAAARAVELKPSNARVWVVQADVHIARGDALAASSALERADVIDAGNVSAKICRAKLALLLGRLDDARKSFDAALVVEPANAEARTGLAQVLLQRGDWASGWTLYEARRDSASAPVRQYPLPEWQGEDCRGRGVLVHSEQGMGDIILFSSCLDDLHELGANIVLDVPQRLAALFARTFPWAEVVCSDARDPALTWHAASTSLDLHVPIGSLPRWFRRQARDFRDGQSFLKADPVRVQAWQRELDSVSRPLIGLAWRGGLAITGKYQRSLELPELVKTLVGTEAGLVSLQHGDTAADLASVQSACGACIHPGLSGYADLDELAALTSACDAVVTVCSTQAHLTGGLGVPGLVLVPVACNWRYGCEGSVSPWYSSLTLARQTLSDDWSSALSVVPEWLAARKGRA